MFYIRLALWIVRGGGPVSIQPTDPAAIPTLAAPPIDERMDDRTLRVLLDMARIDAIDARKPADKIAARRSADDLLDEWLTRFGRPA
jgi:hypothetical protein